MVDDLDAVARCMRDEYAPRFWIERAVVERAARCIWDLDACNVLWRHDRLTPMRRKIGERRLKKGKRSPSMRNLLETSSVALSLDGGPSDGESAFPRIVNLAIPEASGKFSGHSFCIISISGGVSSPIRARARSVREAAESRATFGWSANSPSGPATDKMPDIWGTWLCLPRSG